MGLALSFLREDLQDLRTEMRQEIRDLRADFQALRNEVRQEIRDVRADLGDVRIEIGSLRDDVVALGRRVDELTAHMERRFTRMQTTQIATNIAMAGAIIAAIKL